MNEQQIMAIIHQGNHDEYRFYLTKRHNVNVLTDFDVNIFFKLLKEHCPSIQKVAIEDLSLSDSAAAILGQLIKYYRITHFSLQGSHLGDQCIQSVTKALPYQTESVDFIVPYTTSAFFTNSTLLESLILGAPKATDYGLSLLENVLIDNQSIKKVSLNWSQQFSVSQAWKLAAAIAINNISLVKSDYHGFFHNMDSPNHKAIDFINNFLEAVIKRNQSLAQLNDLIQKYIFYMTFFTAFNITIKKNFNITQAEHGLSHLSLTDLQLKPLTEMQFMSKFDSPKGYSPHRSRSSTFSTPSPKPLTASASPFASTVSSPSIPNNGYVRPSRSFSDIAFDLSSCQSLSASLSDEEDNQDNIQYVSSYSTSPS